MSQNSLLKNFEKRKMSVKDQLFKNVVETPTQPRNKVTVVGCGAVGQACAFSILVQGISNDVVIIDRNDDKVRGEILDINHGAYFMKSATITGGSDFSLSAGSRLIIFTAGARRAVGETRLDLVQKNVEILKALIPKLVRHSPDAILLIVSNPCDILTYVAWKLSGFPRNRVMGSGTHVDTSRFRYLLAQRFGVAITSMHGWIIGEHGDTSVPVWSGVNVAGVRLQDINPLAGLNGDPENWAEVHQKVISAGSEVIQLKGYTSWAIGLSCADLAGCLLRCSNDVRAVSTMVKGLFGINSEVFLSLPCMLNCNGITNIVNIKLNEDEKKKLRESANLMDETQKSINF